jgi:peptidoglycan hydrolase-like protein with peptidoglycan-binding domain
MNQRIKLVQQKLIDRGFPCPVTGIITKETTTAWEAFREANNVPESPCPRSLEEAPYILLTGNAAPIVE